MSKQDVCVEMVKFVETVANLKPNEVPMAQIVMAARELVNKIHSPKDDRIIVHYEKWADGTIKSGGKVFGDLQGLQLAYPDWRYKLVERPIATRRGSAMMGGGK